MRCLLLLAFIFFSLTWSNVYFGYHTAAATPASTTISKGSTSNRSARTAEKKRLKKKKKKKRRRCSQYASPRYRRMVRNWRKLPKIPKPKYRAGYRDLTVYAVNHGERERFFPFREDGTINPEAHEKMKIVCRDKETHAEHAIHPRLIKLLYKIGIFGAVL